LLWIADLDEASVKRKTSPGPTGIPPLMINNITGVVDSVYALEKRMKDEFKSLREKNDEFRKEVAEVKERQTRVLIYLGIAASIGSLLIGIALKTVSDHIFPASSAASSSPTGGPAATTPGGASPAVAPPVPAARIPGPANPPLQAPAKRAPPNKSRRHGS
jgi:hypothetical protein